ncbi:putative nucleic acid-binding protein [Streptomyces phaeoluteigriseus]
MAEPPADRGRPPHDTSGQPACCCARSAGPVDLLIAAVAEEAGLTLLHYDRDFETIARTTGQPVRMIDLK